MPSATKLLSPAWTTIRTQLRDLSAARAANKSLERELAVYTTESDLNDFGAILDRYSEAETADIRRILAGLAQLNPETGQGPAAGLVPVRVAGTGHPHHRSATRSGPSLPLPSPTISTSSSRSNTSARVATSSGCRPVDGSWKMYSAVLTAAQRAWSPRCPMRTSGHSSASAFPGGPAVSSSTSTPTKAARSASPPVPASWPTATVNASPSHSP